MVFCGTFIKHFSLNAGQARGRNGLYVNPYKVSGAQLLLQLTYLSLGLNHFSRHQIYIDQAIIAFKIQNIRAVYLHPFLLNRSAVKNGMTYDLLVLDIEMGAISGMEAAKKIRSVDKKCKIIFITAFDQYMRDAFDVSAIHYLDKPIDAEKLIMVFHRCIKEYKYPSCLPSPVPPEPERRHFHGTFYKLKKSFAVHL